MKRMKERMLTGLLLATVFATAGPLYAMEDEASALAIRQAREAAFNQADFGEGPYDPTEDQALADAEKELQAAEMDDVGAAEAQMALDEANDRALEKAQNIAHMKWQNTLLTPVNWPIGIYKRDVPELVAIAGNLGADYLMYKNLLKRRMDAIESHIKANLDAFLKVLNGVKAAQEVAEKKYDEMNPVTKVFASKQRLKDMQLGPLIQYIWTQHRLVGYNPFTKETVIPIAARFVWQKLSDAFLETMVMNDANMAGSMHAYQKNAQGEYEVCRTPDVVNPVTGERRQGHIMTPFSISNLANWVINPARTTFSRMYSWIGKLDWGPVRAVFGLPAFLYSDEMRLAGEVVTLGLSAQIFDQLNTIHWQQYCVEHKDKLLDILQSYQDALEKFSKGADEVVECERRLKKFIIKGHTPISWMPGTLLRRWWTAVQAGKISYSRYASIPIIAILSYKAAKVGYAAYKIFK